MASAWRGTQSDEAATPHGEWLKKLKECRGLGPSQAWYYTVFAEIPEGDRARLLAKCGYNLRRVVGCWRAEKASLAPRSRNVPSGESLAAAELSAEEMPDWLAEVSWLHALAGPLIEAGEAALASEPDAPDPVRLSPLVSAMRAVLGRGLMPELHAMLAGAEPQP